MAKEKMILDIRLFESDYENISGSSLPSRTGEIYQLPDSSNYLASRIARKLRELEFISGLFDHVYINLTTALPTGEIKYSPRSTESWMKYIDFGLVPEEFNAKSEVEKLKSVESIIFRIIRFISTGEQSNPIIEVENQIEEFGSELEIHHKEKDTKSYNVKITYQIRPNGSESRGLIYYLDKKINQTFKAPLSLKFYEDIYFLASAVSVTNGHIILKPRSSFKADIYNESYDVPIKIKID